MKKVLLIIFLFNSYAVFAQNESGKDSIAFLDSIMSEVDDILDEKLLQCRHRHGYRLL